MGLAGYYQ
jgi:hypothetical protein